MGWYTASLAAQGTYYDKTRARACTHVRPSANPSICQACAEVADSLWQALQHIRLELYTLCCPDTLTLTATSHQCYAHALIAGGDCNVKLCVTCSLKGVRGAHV